MNIPKLKDVAHLKLPQFVKADYPKFVSFIQAYYEFMDNQNLTRNLSHVRDIDTTLPIFVESIKNEIAQIAPDLANNPLFLKHTKEVYVSRGSVESYNLLFRLIYNKDVDIQSPGNKILKASDGRWIQENSFYVKCVSGDVYTLNNSYVYINTKIRGVVQKLKVYVSRINPTNDNGVYELFYNRSYYGTIQVGDSIEMDDLLCVVLPTVTKISIEKNGFGFRVGEIFNIDTSIGAGLQVKVIRVGVNGELERVQIVSHGLGYLKNFTFNIIQDDFAKPYIEKTGNNVKIGDLIAAINDFGFISQNDYSSFDYMSGDYGGSIRGTFYNSNISQLTEQIIATLNCEIGAINVYPGYYNSSIGLISDDSYIQDGNYYQDFSYIVKIDEMLSSYETIVKQFVHPSGHKMFAEYLIETDIELFYDVSTPILRILLPQYNETDETTTAHDSVVSGAYVFTKVVQADAEDITFEFSNMLSTLVVGVFLNGDAVSPSSYVANGNNITIQTALLEGDVIKVKYATITYSINNSQSVFFDLVKGAFRDVVGNIDTLALKPALKRFDVLYGIFDSHTFDVGLNKNDSVGLIDSYIYAVMKGLFDTATTTDPLSMRLRRPIYDSFSAASSNSFGFSKPIIENVSKSDTNFLNTRKSVTDSQGLIDSYIYAVMKPMIDDVMNSDAAVNMVSKSLSDVAGGFVEIFAIMPSRRLSDDITTPSDLITNLYPKKWLSDSTSDFVESVYFENTKAIVELVPLIESIAIETAKLVGDSATLSDLFRNKTIKGFVETFTSSDMLINTDVGKGIVDTGALSEIVKLTPTMKTSDTVSSPTDTGSTTWHQSYCLPSDNWCVDIYDNDNTIYTF